jgi:hypothetical protein
MQNSNFVYDPIETANPMMKRNNNNDGTYKSINNYEHMDYEANKYNKSQLKGGNFKFQLY